MWHHLAIALWAVLYAWLVRSTIALGERPFRKWHHTYIGLALVVQPWWPELWPLGLYLAADDAAQHHAQAEAKANRVPRERWPTSRLHRAYERAVRRFGLWPTRLAAAGALALYVVIRITFT